MKVSAVLAILLSSAGSQAAIFHRRRPATLTRASSLSQRKRLHVNDLIAEPGTLEVEFGGLYSYTTRAATGPATLKYTPDGDSLWVGRTEYSVAFDSFDSAISVPGRVVRFSDRFTLAATSILYDTEHFDLAAAVLGSKLLRDDTGARFGGAIIARYDRGSGSVGTALAWSAATSSSTTNPAGVWDWSGGYGRRFGGHGLLAQISPHLSVVVERATGLDTAVSAAVGTEYQMTPSFALDFSIQRSNLGPDARDRQMALSATWNLGRLRKPAIRRPGTRPAVSVPGGRQFDPR